jgi:peroxiredoxin
MSDLKLGNEAVAFKLPGADGKEHSYDEYKDKNAVVVIFSCNHCPYVRAWEDRMIQIQADYASKGVQLIAINANDASKYPEDSFPNMKERARVKKFNFAYLRDEAQSVARSYGAQRTPEIFLFDKNAVLRYHGAIDDNYDDPKAVKEHYLRKALDAVLAGDSISIAETLPVGCSIKWK